MEPFIMSLLSTNAATFRIVDEVAPGAGRGALAIAKITLTCRPVPEPAPDAGRLVVEGGSAAGLTCRISHLNLLDDFLHDNGGNAPGFPDPLPFPLAAFVQIWRGLVAEAEDRPALVRLALGRVHRLASTGPHQDLEITLGKSGRRGTTGTIRVPYDPRTEWSSDELDFRRAARGRLSRAAVL